MGSQAVDVDELISRMFVDAPKGRDLAREREEALALYRMEIAATREEGLAEGGESRRSTLGATSPPRTKVRPSSNTGPGPSGGS